LWQNALETTQASLEFTNINLTVNNEKISQQQKIIDDRTITEQQLTARTLRSKTVAESLKNDVNTYHDRVQTHEQVSMCPTSQHYLFQG
jgi:hypothetical protein